MKKSCLFTIYFVPLIFLYGCFTGIEGTPKITLSDVKKEHIQVTPEQDFLSDIKNEAPSKWQPGKVFHITDKRIKFILDSDSPLDTINLNGKDMAFEGIERQNSVTGEIMAVLRLQIDGGQKVVLNTNSTYEDLITRDNFEIPFAVDIDIVSAVRNRMRGNTYYITTPRWQNNENGKWEQGLRHVPVEIFDVQPGTSVYPLKVVFRPNDSDKKFSVLMTIGNKRSSTQNFDTLFSFENPRLKYPAIDDDTWNLIINSKVRRGMTKDECHLALGAPTTRGQFPTTAGMAEYWSYAEGIYLLFEDGYLSHVR